MLKNKYLVLFILFILLLILLYFSKATHEQTLKNINTKTINLIKTSIIPSQTVINFYGTYLAYKGDLLSPNAYQNSKYLTDDFKNKLKKEISEKNSFNPILCSNEKPQELNVHSATISSQFVEVLVTQTFQNKSKEHKLKLKLQGKEYKIYDIVCN